MPIRNASKRATWSPSFGLRVLPCRPRPEVDDAVAARRPGQRRARDLTQETGERTRAGETGPLMKWGRRLAILFVSLALGPGVGSARGQQPPAPTPDEKAVQDAQEPANRLRAFSFQNNFDLGIGPADRTGYRFFFQPWQAEVGRGRWMTVNCALGRQARSAACLRSRTGRPGKLSPGRPAACPGAWPEWDRATQQGGDGHPRSRKRP